MIPEIADGGRFHVLAINLNHGIDIAQVWAEVFYIWQQGEQSWMTQNEFLELNEHNKSHEQISPLEESLCCFYDFSQGWENLPKIWCSATEVLRSIGYNNPTKYQCTQMGKIITKLTGLEPRKKESGRFHGLVRITGGLKNS